MNQTLFTPPERGKSAFHCPHCRAFSNQLWSNVYESATHRGGLASVDGFYIAWCTHCHHHTLWVGDILIYPDASQAPSPNPDLPDWIRLDYEEATMIISKSPRGAAALLRLCIQKLCKHLGETGNNINNDISSLVKKGLNPAIQKSLDIVRVIGNEAVHPGTIDFKDNPEIAIVLCKLINIIAETMITQPRMIDSLYESLPDEKKEQIQKRDKR